MIKPVKILVAEDEVIISEDICGCLRKAGYEVTAVHSAPEAIAAEEASRPDLILMDIHLNSDKDGVDTAMSITGARPVPIIFLTDIDDKGTLERAAGIQNSTYLLKPFNERQILLSIRQALYKASQETEPDTTEKKDKPEDECILHDCLFIKKDRDSSFKKVSLSDILYIKAERAYCQIYISDNHTYTLSMSMNQAHARILQPSFVQVHRSYVVNLNKVTEVKGNMLVAGGTEIQIGDSYKPEVIKKFPMLR